MPLRLVFMGTPDFAVPTLLEIVGQRPRGRRGLYARAEARRAAAWSCSRRRSSARRERLRHSGADAADRCAATRRRPAFRAHRRRCRRGGRLWPDPAASRSSTRRRSAASTCTPRCCRAGAARRRSTAPIMAGDAETGVMVMQMEEGLDTGPVAMAERVPIGARHDRGRTARRARAARRRPDGARARARWSAAR